MDPTEFQIFRRAGRRGDRNMLCEVIMRTAVQCVSPDDPAAKSARLMREHEVCFVLVCDREGKVLGMVNDRDLAVRLVADELPASTKVGEIMSVPVLSCGAQERVGKAQELMMGAGKSHIVCVDEAGRLEGLISLSDIVRLKDVGVSRAFQLTDVLEPSP